MDNNNFQKDGMQNTPQPQPQPQPQPPQPLYQQQQYTPTPQPQYQQHMTPPQPYNNKPMTIGAWIVTFIIMIIPIINIIMVFVWAFGDGNKSKKTYFQATLIMVLIGIVLSIVVSITAGAFFSSIFNNVDFSQFNF